MSKDINLMVGRFQPFTKGHLKCVETAFAENSFPVRICMIGNTKFDSKHPFSDELIAEEMDIIKKQYSDKIEGTQTVKNGNIAGIVYWLNKEGYTVHSLVCGTDRAADYQKAVDLARSKPDRNPFIDEFKIIEVKRGDEDISATQVRATIKSNNIKGFEKLMPDGTSTLFDKLKTEISQVKESMKTLTDFVKQALNEGSIHEKLSFSDKIGKFLFGVEEQHEYVLRLKHHIEQQSKDRVSIFVKTIRQIKRDIDDCINIDEPCWGANDESFRQCLEMGHMYNTTKLDDDRPFVCIYAKRNPDKYFVLMDSVWFIDKKTINGNREIIGGFTLSDESDLLDDTSKFHQNINYSTKLMDVVNFVLHPDFYEKYLESKTKEQIKSDIRARIDALQKEIDDLKKSIK